MKRVVVVGGGFAGVSAVRSLRNLDQVQVHLIDRRNYHLFQPLLYQVAMAGLNPSDIAVPFRRMFSDQKNLEITLAEVSKIDLKYKRVFYDEKWEPYDYLVLCAGAKHFYFNNSEWEEVAPGLKTLEQATEIRRRVLLAFELAEKEKNQEKQRQLLTFVVVGGGPTGVELAGAISEMASRTLYKDYRFADLSKTRVLLVEAGDRLLPAFPENLSLKTKKSLEGLKVEVRLNEKASGLSKEGLNVGSEFISARTIIWAAGVRSSSLSQDMDVKKDQLDRIQVNKDLSLPGYPEVFVLGDQALFWGENKQALPGIAPVAIQQGTHVGKLIKADERGKPRTPFKYLDKGIMATIGRSRAVASVGGFQFSGFFAWILWVVIHIAYLMCFRNKIFVFLQWIWAYFKFGYGARLIVHKTWQFYSGKKIKLDAD